MPTTYTHSRCSPRYMVVISTVYHPHYMYPQHVTRHPHYMCYPHHMYMVWVTLTLFPTAYDPRHKLFSTAYTHGIYTPDIPWVYAVDTTCICRGSHMPWVHMSSADEALIDTRLVRRGIPLEVLVARCNRCAKRNIYLSDNTCPRQCGSSAR